MPITATYAKKTPRLTEARTVQNSMTGMKNEITINQPQIFFETG